MCSQKKLTGERYSSNTLQHISPEILGNRGYTNFSPSLFHFHLHENDEIK